MSFGILALIVCVGLLGPLLSAVRPNLFPVLVGEIVAGIVIGRTGFRWLDTTNVTVEFLANVGFAMLMFAAGMNVPLRNRALLGSIRRGAVAAAFVTLLAIPGGFLLSRFHGADHPAVFALLLATGSAAVALPILDEAGLLARAAALTVLVQVTVADVASIVAVPLVLQPDRAARSVLGTIAVVACAVGILGVASIARRRGVVKRLRRLSKQNAWALDLRVSLLVLFALAWLATVIGTSILIAGFAVGLMAAWLGGPKRFSRQVTGVAQGLFVPLFFVVLGAKIDLRAIASEPSLVGLAASLVALNVAIRLIVARLTHQPLGAALVATSQLGVPAAVVALGFQEHVISPGVGGAIITAALVTVALTAAGAALLGREAPTAQPRPAT
ncbi:MAG TPA: cation:proton antiporter [Gaiellaceae bacterium]|nr:cation:proton antiporter [Gaiellaceae bacterium]